jgi:hypothetical protein
MTTIVNGPTQGYLTRLKQVRCRMCNRGKLCRAPDWLRHHDQQPGTQRAVDLFAQQASPVPA